MIEKYKTRDNTYAMFPVRSRVKVIVPAQDFYFFNGETGTVIKNGGRYLSIIVQFDEPRHFEGGYIQHDFNFEPQDLILLPEQPKKEKVDWEAKYNQLAAIVEDLYKEVKRK